MPAAEMPPGGRHDLLIPCAAASAPACQALLPEMQLPNLQILLSRLSLQAVEEGNEHSLSPPHERAMAKARG
ncbi:MAG: hypothetical protein EP308_09470, partial [Burkholderiales bacterium]